MSYLHESVRSGDLGDSPAQLRDALIRCEILLRHSIRGDGERPVATIDGEFGRTLQQARRALGLDVYIPPWLLDENADLPAIAEAKP